MSTSNLRDDNWAGVSRLHKIVAIILALILALTWWLGRAGADGTSRFGCLPGAATSAASGATGAAASAVTSGASVTATAPTTPAPAASVQASAPSAPAAPAASTPTAAASPAPADSATAPATSAAAPAAAAPAPAPAASPAAPAAEPPKAATAPETPAKPEPVAKAEEPAKPQPPESTATAAAASSASSSNAASNLPLARVFFGMNRFEVPTNPGKEYGEVIAYLKTNSGSKARLSGFHDPTGNRAHNVELAENRSRAVRARLLKDGVARDRIVIDKPTETTGTGDFREARRVEISVQP